MKEQKLKIIIVDDNETFRENLKYYIKELLFWKVINEAPDGESFLALNNIHEADIILMDIEMPKLNGLKATKQILIKDFYVKVIALTNYMDKAYLSELIKNGFKGCVFKNNIDDEIERAIKTVMSGSFYFPEEIKI